jgi:uncharacterized integral membrane protein
MGNRWTARIVGIIFLILFALLLLNLEKQLLVLQKQRKRSAPTATST